MRKNLTRLLFALLATLLSLPAIRADVGDTYKLVTSADQLEEGAHYMIGSKELKYIMANQTANLTLGNFKNSYCMAPVKEVDLSSGQVAETDAMAVIVLKKNGEKWQLINARNEEQGMYMYFNNASGNATWQTTLFSATPDNFTISVTDAGVATISNGKTNPNIAAQNNRGFVCGGGYTVELYKQEVNASDPAAKPVIKANGEETTGGTFIENTVIKVTSDKAKTLKVWLPGATEASEQNATYSFPLTVSGEYKFQGVNAVGSSEVVTATLTVGKPQLPVVTADGEGLANGAKISAQPVTVSSRYALTLTVGKPDGTSDDITTLPYTFTPKQAGKYTFTGKNSTEASEPFTLTVKIPHFQLVKDAAALVPGTKFVVASWKQSTSLSAPQLMTGETYKNLADNNYVGLKGVDCEIADNGVLTSADGLVLTVTEKDSKTYLMSGDKGLQFTYVSNKPQLYLTDTPTAIAFDGIDNEGMSANIKNVETSGTNNYLRFDDQVYKGNKQSFFLPFGKDVWKNIQIFAMVQEGAAPEAPTVNAGETKVEADGIYTLTDGTEVKVGSVGATSLEITLPDGTKATSETASYSFPLTQSGKYVFTAINANGNTAIAATLNVGKPQLPVVRLGDKEVENNSTVNPGTLSISSRYATRLVITLPDATTDTIAGAEGTFTPLQSGKYTIAGQNSKEASENFAFTVVIPVWRQVYAASQLKDLTHLVIGALSENNVMTGTAKGNGLAPAAASFANGEVTTAQAQEFVLTLDYDEIDGTPVDGQWRLITSGDKGLNIGSSVSIGTAALIDYSVTTDGNAVIAPRGNKTLSLQYSDANTNFGRYNNGVCTPVQIYRKLPDGGEAPDQPIVFVNGELLTADNCDVAAGTEIKVVAPGATTISTLNGETSTANGYVYTFTLAQSGTFTFTGVNAIGSSAARTVTLTIPAAYMPVVVLDGDTVTGSSAWIGAGSKAVVTSKFAESISVTDPDGNVSSQAGDNYTFTPAAGTYKFQGISPTGNSETVTVTFKAKVYTLVTSDDQLVAGGKYVLISNCADAEQENVRQDPPLGMGSGLYENKMENLCFLNGLKGDSVTVSGDQAIVSEGVLELTLEGETGAWKLMTSATNGISVARPSNGSANNTSWCWIGTPSVFAITIADGKYASIVSPTTTSQALRFFTSRGCFSNINATAWGNVSLYRLAEEELTADNLADLVSLGKRNPGKAIQFTGSAVVSGLYNNRLWLKDAAGNAAVSQDPEGAAFKVDVCRGHAISGFSATVAAEAPFTLTFTPALTGENVARTSELPVPVKKTAITTADMNQLVQMQGSATFTPTDGTLTVDGQTYAIEPVALPASNTARQADSEDPAIWKTTMAWPTDALAGKYFAGYVTSAADDAVKLLVARITDSEITTGVGTVALDGVVIADGIIFAPAGTRIYTPAGLTIPAGRTVPAPGTYIIVTASGHTAKVYVK